MTVHADRAAAAQAALNAPLNLTGAAVVASGSSAKVVISTRINPAHSAWIITEAGGRDITPSALAAELIAEAIAARVARSTTGQQAPLISAEVLHRAIDVLAAGQCLAA